MIIKGVVLIDEQCLFHFRFSSAPLDIVSRSITDYLYNAPSTMNHYYQQEVQHDMYGGGWNEKNIG